MQPEIGTHCCSMSTSIFHIKFEMLDTSRNAEKNYILYIQYLRTYIYIYIFKSIDFNGFPVGIPTFEFQCTSKFFRPTLCVRVLASELCGCAGKSKDLWTKKKKAQQPHTIFLTSSNELQTRLLRIKRNRQWVNEEKNRLQHEREAKWQPFQTYSVILSGSIDITPVNR